MAALGNSVKTEFIVGGKYRLTRKIGSGSFGDIYLGINISNGEVNITYFYHLLCELLFGLSLLCIQLFYSIEVGTCSNSDFYFCGHPSSIANELSLFARVFIITNIFDIYFFKNLGCFFCYEFQIDISRLITRIWVYTMHISTYFIIICCLLG